MDDLPARLSCIAERNCLPARIVAGLFGKFALRRRKRRFAGCDQSFRNGSCAYVFSPPEWTARMAKQNLDGTAALPEQQKAGTLIFG
jgi:hypothetical protein